MKILMVLMAFFLLAGCMMTTVDEPPPQETGRGEWLIKRVKVLADEGALFNAANAAKILHLSMDAEHSYKISDCKNPYDSTFSMDRYTAQNPSWFEDTSESILHMVRPGFAVNPTEIMEAPKFYYTIAHSHSCTGRSEPMDYTEAELSFRYSSGYACITPAMLQKVLPEAKYTPASDGALPYFYIGKFDDISKTYVEFHFFVGARCLLGITIRQSEKTGKRFLRARSRFQKCEKQVKPGFCSSQPHFTWGDGNKIDDMDAYVAEKCGTLASYFDAEPLSGEDPPPIKPYTAFSSCEDE